MAWDGTTERRKHRRAEIHLVVEFTGVDEAGREQATRLQTLNLSAGGFYCGVNREMPELTRLGLRFVFPPFGRDHTAEHTIDCEAVVVRCNKESGDSDTYRCAACFTSISADDRRFIEQYVEWFALVYTEES
jgi:c-di-GMP-binding flagellar brake protein YcgR